MNVLAVGAHFDDVEIGCGGTIAKHIFEGDSVTVLVITDSAYTDKLSNYTRTKEVALKEGLDASKVMGYSLVCGNLQTRCVVFNPELVDLIESTINKNAIDIIYTHWDCDVHQDHQSIGKATLAAGRKTHSLLMYRSILYQSASTFEENFYVDISDFIEQKMKAIGMHKSEVSKFGSDWLNFWKQEAKLNGQHCGTGYAEVFKLVKFLA